MSNILIINYNTLQNKINLSSKLSDLKAISPNLLPNEYNVKGRPSQSLIDRAKTYILNSLKTATYNEINKLPSNYERIKTRYSIFGYDDIKDDKYTLTIKERFNLIHDADLTATDYARYRFELILDQVKSIVIPPPAIGAYDVLIYAYVYTVTADQPFLQAPIELNKQSPQDINIETRIDTLDNTNNLGSDRRWLYNHVMNETYLLKLNGEYNVSYDKRYTLIKIIVTAGSTREQFQKTLLYNIEQLLTEYASFYVELLSPIYINNQKRNIENLSIINMKIKEKKYAIDNITDTSSDFERNTCWLDLFADHMHCSKSRYKSKNKLAITLDDCARQIRRKIMELNLSDCYKNGLTIPEATNLAKELGFTRIHIYSPLILYNNTCQVKPILEYTLNPKKNTTDLPLLNCMINNGHVYKITDLQLKQLEKQFELGDFEIINNIDDYTIKTVKKETVIVKKPIHHFFINKIKKGQILNVKYTNNKSNQISSFIYENRLFIYKEDSIFEHYNLFDHLANKYNNDDYKLTSKESISSIHRSLFNRLGQIYSQYADTLNPELYSLISQLRNYPVKGWVKDRSAEYRNMFSYDLNKAFLKCLINHKWPALNMNDELIEFDPETHIIDNYHYYYLSFDASINFTVKTGGLLGNSDLYPGIMVNLALSKNYITYDNITHVLQPKTYRPSFKPVLDDLLEIYDLKQANNIIRKLIGTFRQSDIDRKFIYSSKQEELEALADLNPEMKGSIDLVYFHGSDEVLSIEEYDIPIKNIDPETCIYRLTLERKNDSIRNYQFIYNMITKLTSYYLYLVCENHLDNIVGFNIDSIILNKEIHFDPDLCKQENKDILLTNSINLNILPEFQFKSNNIAINDPKHINGGFLINSPGGYGKTHLIANCIKEFEKNNLKWAALTPTRISMLNLKKALKTKIPDSALNNIMTDCFAFGFDGENKKISLPKLDYLIIDEVFAMKHQNLSIIINYKLNGAKFKCYCLGDDKQTNPYMEESIKESALMMLCDYNKVILTKNYRIKNCTDKYELQYLINLENLRNTDIYNFNHPKAEYSNFNLALTRKKCDDINNLISPPSKGIFIGQKWICRINSDKWSNGERFVVTSITDGKKLIYKIKSEFNEFEITEYKLKHDFVLGYCITIASCQGLTINEPYTIHEYDQLSNYKGNLYTALSRSTSVYLITVA